MLLRKYTGRVPLTAWVSQEPLCERLHPTLDAVHQGESGVDETFCNGRHDSRETKLPGDLNNSNYSPPTSDSNESNTINNNKLVENCRYKQNTRTPETANNSTNGSNGGSQNPLVDNHNKSQTDRKSVKLQSRQHPLGDRYREAPITRSSSNGTGCRWRLPSILSLDIDLSCADEVTEILSADSDEENDEWEDDDEDIYKVTMTMELINK